VAAEFAETRDDLTTQPKTACYARALARALPAPSAADPAVRGYAFQLARYTVRMTVSLESSEPPPPNARAELAAAAAALAGGAGQPWVEGYSESNRSAPAGRTLYAADLAMGVNFTTAAGAAPLLASLKDGSAKLKLQVGFCCSARAAPCHPVL
jgi:hypothetical protein